MAKTDPIDLLFGGMEKLGPGSPADTLHVLGMLPRRTFRTIVDAGCGTGQQSLVLAKRLQRLVHAVDSHEPFLKHLAVRAEKAGVAHLIQAHCMDMACIPRVFQQIDLLWSEGAAYNIGFPNALRIWRPAIRRNGCAVVSELSWLRADGPAEVRRFFAAAYPDMRSSDENLTVVKDAGYRVLGMHTLPDAAWIEGYYEILEPRAKALLGHPDESVRGLAAETIEEIRIFARAEGSYGYMFYALQKA